MQFASKFSNTFFIELKLLFYKSLFMGNNNRKVSATEKVAQIVEQEKEFWSFSSFITVNNIFMPLCHFDFYTAHIFAFQKNVLFIRIFWIVFEAKQKENSSKKRKRRLYECRIPICTKARRSANKFCKSQNCKLADLPNLLDWRTFRKCSNVRICDMRTQSFFCYMRICDLHTQFFSRPYTKTFFSLQI